jgi:tRNA (guanosine-2'-O-)-methyltransferase
MEKFILIYTSIMSEQQINDLIPYLEGFITDKRKARLQQVLSQRSSHMRIVLENVFQAHNTSAVLRSCDCFGVQHVHFIENNNHLKISDDVALGSSNWLSIHRHKNAENNTLEALAELKKEGYKIVATSPHKNDFTLNELPIEHKFALVFGTELEGISEDVVKSADAFVRIPMYGFTESFNISVSAAICMYELSRRIRESVADYRLNEKEKTQVYFEWLKNAVQKSDALIADFLSKQK